VAQGPAQPGHVRGASGRGRGDGRGRYFAWRYSDARQIALIKQEFQAGLERPDLTAGYLEEMEAHVGQLSQLAPEQAAAARQRLHQGFAESGPPTARQPLPEDRSHMRRPWELLAARAPELVPELRETLSKRLRTGNCL